MKKLAVMVWEVIMLAGKVVGSIVATRKKLEKC